MITSRIEPVTSSNILITSPNIYQVNVMQGSWQVVQPQEIIEIFPPSKSSSESAGKFPFLPSTDCGNLWSSDKSFGTYWKWKPHTQFTLDQIQSGIEKRIATVHIWMPKCISQNLQFYLYSQRCLAGQKTASDFCQSKCYLLTCLSHKARLHSQSQLKLNVKQGSF